jgi:hypothetical protein
VRENLKLRLLNARLALFARQFEIAQADLREAQGSIDRYFDRSSKRVAAARRTRCVRSARRRARPPCRGRTSRCRHWRLRPPAAEGPSPMRSVIWLVLVAVAAVVAATTFGRNDGLVSLYWNGWRTDLSLNLFVLLPRGDLPGAGGADARRAVAPDPAGARAPEWRTHRRERAAQAALREALLEYFGARYGRAHKAAHANHRHPRTPPRRGPTRPRRVRWHICWQGQPASPAGPSAA